MDLSNSLIGAHTGTIIQRIAAAAGMVSEGAEAMPTMVDHYFNWVLNIASQAKASNFEVGFTDGNLSGNLWCRRWKEIIRRAGRYPLKAK